VVARTITAVTDVDIYAPAPRSHRAIRPRRRTRARNIACVGVAIGTTALLLLGTQLPEASAAPRTPNFAKAIDRYAVNDPQDTCSPSAKPGIKDLRTLFDKTYGKHTAFVGRACDVGGTSEHKEGRALDYMLNVNNAGERAIANDFLNWLLATDQYGNRHAMARRLGVMYIIWNRQQWRAYRPGDGWQSYGGSNPHTDHIHISFSWAGALKQTSWWTGGGGGPTGTLTGRLPDINQDGKADIIGRLSNGVAQVSHGTGPDLFAGAVNFGSDWNKYDAIFVADINQDGRNDIIGRLPNGVPEVSHGTGPDTFARAVAFGSDWNIFTGIWIADIDHDGKNDIIGRLSSGNAVVAHGTGPDTFAQTVGFGAGWNVYTAMP